MLAINPAPHQAFGKDHPRSAQGFSLGLKDRMLKTSGLGCVRL